jgi:hypothetical protein
MPKVVDEALLMPLSLSGKTLEEQAELLNAEHARLVANARSIAFYAIRSSMFDDKGSVAQSERTYRYMWLAEFVHGLLVQLPPRKSPSLWTPEAVEAEYLKLEARAKAHWEDHGGVLRFDGDARPPPWETGK